MKYKISALLLIFLSFFSCSRRLCACDPYQEPFYKAEVVNTNDINCSRPLIRIDASDTAAVSRVSGKYTDLYVANQVSGGLNNTGQKLYITISPFNPGEDFVCTTIGVTYEHLKVTSSARRD